MIIRIFARDLSRKLPENFEISVCADNVFLFFRITLRVYRRIRSYSFEFGIGIWKFLGAATFCNFDTFGKTVIGNI